MFYDLFLIITISIILIMVIFLLYSWGLVRSHRKTNDRNFVLFWILSFMMLQSIIDTTDSLRSKPLTRSRVYQFTTSHKPLQGIIQRIQNSCSKKKRVKQMSSML
jgi:hypothetical protein